MCTSRSSFLISTHPPLLHSFAFRPAMIEEDTVFEESGARYSTKAGHSVQGRVLNAAQRGAHTKAGDGTVPYYSLSWCHSWFDESKPINVTHAPNRATYEPEDVLTGSIAGEPSRRGVGASASNVLAHLQFFFVFLLQTRARSRPPSTQRRTAAVARITTRTSSRPASTARPTACRWCGARACSR
jgi:hypothetical protein